jgi:hypothetical protein
MIPYTFIRIEIWRVSREFLQMDVIGTAVAHKDVYLFCPRRARRNAFMSGVSPNFNG